MSESDETTQPVIIATQDPKYVIIDGALANAFTGEFIPADEPIFIMRGKDMKAHEAMRYYSEICTNEQHKDAVGVRILDFIKFADVNDDVMGDPDTDIEVPGQETTTVYGDDTVGQAGEGVSGDSSEGGK